MRHLQLVGLVTLCVLLQAAFAHAQSAASVPAAPLGTEERCATHLRRGEYQEARSLAEEYLRHDPNNPDFYEILGIAVGGQGDLNGAIRAFTQAIRCRSRRPSEPVRESNLTGQGLTSVIQSITN